jgi:acid phosphatase family membrane protein YuiD
VGYFDFFVLWKVRAEERKTGVTARILTILFWTLFMSGAAFLIIDGKGATDHVMADIIAGAGIGVVLGYLFSRKLKSKVAHYPTPP